MFNISADICESGWFLGTSWLVSDGLERSIYLGYLQCLSGTQSQQQCGCDTITSTLVQLNVIQHNSSAITPTFVKLIMFNICWDCVTRCWFTLLGISEAVLCGFGVYWIVINCEVYLVQDFILLLREYIPVILSIFSITCPIVGNFEYIWDTNDIIVWLNVGKLSKLMLEEVTKLVS